MNTEAVARHALAFAARHRLHPNFAIYEPGFARAGAALARAAGVKTPVYRLMFCEGLAVGFPPRPYALSAYVSLLEEEAGSAPWMIAAVNADLRPLFPETIARGGHIRVGLEDAPLGTRATNLELVEEAVQIMRDHGAEPASPADVRQVLAGLG
jgi:3-keto-5-aminohexanoate cleavage enzyme